MADNKTEKPNSLTRNFYLKRLQKQDDNLNGQLSAQVGWSSYENQLCGFKMATDLEKINWQQVNSVLDIGCGYGTLADFLRSQCGFQGNYTGIDLMPEYIEVASSMYKHEKNTFLTSDFFNFDWQDRKFDVVISLGIISVNFDYPEQSFEKSMLHAEKAIIKMVALTHQALSFYFPNQDNITPETRKDELAYYPISKIEQIIQKKISKPYQSYSIKSYPNSNDIRTMVKLFFIHDKS